MQVNNKKALIVDDSRTAFMVLARTLAQYQIDSVHAKSGDEALNYLKQHQVDVIFLDQAMPGKDGFETIKAIKENSKADHIPVMMFTARSGQDYIQAVQELGAEGVLQKELSVDEVEEALIKLSLWSPKAGRVADDNDGSFQPSSDEKLKVWLESFLENQFSPQLSSKVRKATDDLRRDTIHYGKRMLDEIAKTDKQQHMIKEVKGQTDYLKQLFANSFEQYKFISKVFITLLVVLIGGFMWLAYQTSALSSEQKILQKQLVTLTDEANAREQRLIQEVQQQSGAIERFIQQEKNQTQELNQNYSLYSNQGKVGEVVGVAETGRLLTGLSEKGYLFVLAADGRVTNNAIKRYYIQPNCAGPAFVDSLPGVVLRVNEVELGYTELTSEPMVYQPTSWQDMSGKCHQYESGDDVLVRELRSNDQAVTGVRDTVYFQVN